MQWMLNNWVPVLLVGGVLVLLVMRFRGGGSLAESKATDMVADGSVASEADMMAVGSGLTAAGTATDRAARTVTGDVITDIATTAKVTRAKIRPRPKLFAIHPVMLRKTSATGATDATAA